MGPGETLRRPKWPPQPYWVSVAGRRHPSIDEKVGERMEQNTERKRDGRRSADTEKEKNKRKRGQQKKKIVTEYSQHARCQGPCLCPSRFPGKPRPPRPCPSLPGLSLILFVSYSWCSEVGGRYVYKGRRHRYVSLAQEGKGSTTACGATSSRAPQPRKWCLQDGISQSKEGGPQK